MAIISPDNNKLIHTLSKQRSLFVESCSKDEALDFHRLANSVLSKFGDFVSLSYLESDHTAIYMLGDTIVFDSKDDAIEYFAPFINKHEWEEIIVNNEKTAACGTCLVYEDELCSQCKNWLTSPYMQAPITPEKVTEVLQDLIETIACVFGMPKPSDQVPQEYIDKLTDIYTRSRKNLSYDEAVDEGISELRDLALDLFQQNSEWKILNICNEF